MKIDIGICAYNEEDSIGLLFRDLGQQTVFTDASLDVAVYLLANGCSDQTLARAEAARATLPPAIAERITLLDDPVGGKSRTVHRYIHDISRREADILTFMDADIRLPETGTLLGMVRALQTRPELYVFNSRPIKDIVHYKLKTGTIGKLIASGGDGLSDYRKSICGQLYMVRSAAVRRIGLPAGLPVEDGFMRAMLLTDLLSTPEDTGRIDGAPDLFHTYESIRSLKDLLHHQTRIVLGSAVNAALYARLRKNAPTEPQAHAVLMGPAQAPDWLPAIIRTDLPRWPYGFVPLRFVTKRISAFRGKGKGLKSLAVLMAGLALDSLSWARASWIMARGRSTGFW